MLKRLLPLLLCGALAACVQLLGGDDEPVFSDGGAPAADAAEDSSPSAGGGGRGGGDASSGTRPDGGAGRWCPRPNSGAVIKCWDFDDANDAFALTNNWSGQDLGTGSLWKSEVVSSPNAFLSRVTTTASKSFLLWRTEQLAPFSSLRFAFELIPKSCTLSTTAPITVARLEFIEQTKSGLAILLQRNPSGRLFARALTPGTIIDDEFLGSGVPAADWSSVVFTVTRGTTSAASVTMGTTAQFTNLPLGNADSLQVTLGLSGSADPEVCEAVYDNVDLSIYR